MAKDIIDHIKPHEVITPIGSRFWPNFPDVWRQRELVKMLVQKSINSRYHQAILGIFWALITPVCYMVIMNVFFGLLGGFKSGDATPYSLFLLSALVPYQYFGKCLGDGATSIINNEALIGKVYFPRLIFPIVTTLAGTVDFVIAFVFFIICFVVMQQPLGWHMLALPGAVLALFILAISSSVFISVLTVKYRDVRYALPTIIQLMFFGSPIWYPSTLMPAQYHWVWGLNPFAGIVEAFRWCFFGTETVSLPLITSSACTTVLLGVFGLFYFNKIQRQLADMI